MFAAQKVGAAGTAPKNSRQDCEFRLRGGTTGERLSTTQRGLWPQPKIFAGREETDCLLHGELG